MAVNINRIKKSVDKLISGNHYCNSGLGVTITIKKYAYTTNDYGDKVIGTTSYEDQIVKGIIVREADYDQRFVTNVSVRDGEIRVFINIDIEIQDTADNYYEFEIDGVTYLLVYLTKIGNIGTNDFGGVMQQLTLKPKTI